jgi:hypothetical protein
MIVARPAVVIGWMSPYLLRQRVINSGALLVSQRDTNARVSALQRSDGTGRQGWSSGDGCNRQHCTLSLTLSS